ncbi:unnamed protein product [Rhizoctonia solani]|uniref:Uncharacterized protein n=1 Tax=Rhizoctonia solani TaxID=456999 RepID=A0A8H3CHC7_9AGAM|nr:unnamed protein product [Rhizoctonia solani]
MPSESGGNVSADPLQASIRSIAKATDALARATAALAATAQAFAREVSLSATSGENNETDLERISETGFEGDHAATEGLNQVPDLDNGNGERESSPSVVDAEDQAKFGSMYADMDREALGNPKEINHSYRLLVDSEADVLLFVCALIDKRQSVICYMPCGNIALGAYKQLIESVTEATVYILNSSASLTWDQGYIDFIGSQCSVLLVPETLLPQHELEGENSWVIHVGWPASLVQYTNQQKTHRANKNILVAFSGDQLLYSSANSIINLTEPWPEDGASFRGSVSILRPLYEVILSEIPLDLKAQVYLRANVYLQEIWHWSGEHTGGYDTPMPEVSPDFVTQNDLQSAVIDRLLRVEEDDGVDDGDSEGPGPLPDFTPRSDPLPTHIGFQHTASHTYFTVDEEFDAIPLICFISQQYNKVICFLEGQGALGAHQQLFSQVAGRQAIFPSVPNNNQAVEEAVVQFLSSPLPAILLLAYNTTNLPSALAEGSIDCCLYWGFSVPLRQAKRNRALINCPTTIIIMTTAQRQGRVLGNDIKKHPSIEIPFDLTENSILAPMRNRTKSVLMAKKKNIVKYLYTNRMYGVGSTPRSSLSAEDAARRVNQYAARVLLHGDIADGSETFPPLAERPPISKKVVEKFGLEPAVEAGLLTIGN